MKTTSFLSILACVLVLGSTTAVGAAEKKEQTVTLDQVPQKVKDTLAEYAKPAEVKSIEKSVDDGQNVYEFDIEQGSRSYELSVTTQGKFWGTEEDMELSAMPADAQKALQTQAGGAKLTETEKLVDEDKKVTYQAGYEKGGKKFEVEVEANGKLVNSEDVTGEDH